ncbi:MAG: DUF1349 domain-containing protein [Christensenella sp.]|uniref:DUF1349 domain-containing protein n=1 Tax=Christensenella sp. TaxID=1935934 RepID=UPI002B1E98A6|nr:DUF1349 domain-containing protein [Christensenella sp.]MEA5003951.1 DUF1349 domain-containing protein [Christensenella sp.]
MDFDLKKAKWSNEPQKHEETENKVVMYTQPETDIWQRTYYGACQNNPHALLIDTKENEFTFTVKTTFATASLYDHCGVLLYLDEENWAKVCTEYETDDEQMLGSVVTNLGYSDWGGTYISEKVKRMYYRVSRRGNDFLFESATDGENFKQMRFFHMFCDEQPLSVGLFACSPYEKGFKAVFEDMKFSECVWPAPSAE